MKKLLIAVLIIGGVITTGYCEQHYTRKDCKVVRITGNVVTVMDQCGYIWQFEDEGYAIGDVVDLKMFSGATVGNIADDEIVKVVRH